jgi:hypothetical protein
MFTQWSLYKFTAFSLHEKRKDRGLKVERTLLGRTVLNFIEREHGLWAARMGRPADHALMAAFLITYFQYPVRIARYTE